MCIRPAGFGGPGAGTRATLNSFAALARSSDLLAGLRESWGPRSEEEAATEGRWLGLTALLALASFIPSTPKSIGEARRSWLTKDCALPVPHSCNCSRNALLAREGFQIAGSDLAGKGSFTVARTWASLIPPLCALIGSPIASLACLMPSANVRLQGGRNAAPCGTACFGLDWAGLAPVQADRIATGGVWFSRLLAALFAARIGLGRTGCSGSPLCLARLRDKIRGAVWRVEFRCHPDPGPSLMNPRPCP